MKGTKKQSREQSLNVIIPLVVYPFDVMISCNESDDALKTKLNELGVKWDSLLEMPPTTSGRAVMLECNRTIIRLKQIPYTIEEYGILAHEIFHAVVFILNRLGMSLTRKSDEAYAYLIGYLTTEIYKHL